MTMSMKSRTWSVLIGVPDEAIDSVTSSWTTNKLGGEPDWMHKIPDCDDVYYPLCGSCKKQQALVTQIYCPLDGSLYHRALLIFCCLSNSCWIADCGWSVYRIQTLFQEENENNSVQHIENHVAWTCDEDDWGDDEDEVMLNTESTPQQESHPMASLVCAMQSVSCSSAEKEDADGQSKLRTKDSLLTCFKPFYLNVYDEADVHNKTTCQVDDEHIAELLAKYDKLEMIEGNALNNASTSEQYESSTINKTFQKFQKAVRNCPEQVVRYSRGGEPLLLFDDNRKDNLNDTKSCKHCGGPTIFELQLMPGLIPYLSNGVSNVEFGNVMVFTCEKNCWNDLEPGQNRIKEHIMIQADPDLKYFKGQH